MMKTWQVVSVLCVVCGWEIESTISSDVKQCPIGTTVVMGKYLLPTNSSCKKCILCHFGEDNNFHYIFCPSRIKLSVCHEEMFLYMWSSEVKSWGNGGPWKPPREVEVPMEEPAIEQTTSKPASLVPADHMSLQLALVILLTILASGLAIIIAGFVCLRKTRKRMSLYGAISAQRRPQRDDDENYVRYTKDPTSSASRLKDSRVRASWPRSASRSENPYLLEVSSREPVPNTVSSNGREDNPDSNSAHYVFIQTFSGGASGASSSAPLSNGTRALDATPLSTETALPEKVCPSPDNSQK